MFDDLEEATAALEAPVDNESITQILRLRDRLEAKLAHGIAAFDASGLWELDHASSATAWLRAAGMTGGAAVSLVRTGRCLRHTPALAEAWLDGRLCGGQVQAVVANVSDRVAATFAEHQAELVPLLVGLSVRETTIVMQAWRAKADAELDEGEPPDHQRSLHLSRSFAGRGELNGSFDPESTSVLENAIRVAGTEDDEATGKRSPSERRADALVDVCRYFLDHQESSPTTGRHRPHVNVVVDINDLDHGRTLDGVLLDPDAVRVLLCDANLHRVVTDGRSTILDYGRSTRTVPPSLFTALVLRDGHCRLVEGCDRGPNWCDAHHVTPWEDGGVTTLDNLVLGCSRHHHLLHRRRWRQRLDPDGTYTVTTADGQTWSTLPRGGLSFGLPFSLPLAS